MNEPFILGVVSPQGAVGDALLENTRAKKRNGKLSDERVAYLVPEHCYPLDEGGRELADQYLLGLIAYQTLSRQIPDVVKNKEKVRRGDMPQFTQPPPLYDFVPSCPASLSEIIRRMSMTSPRDRYSSLAEATDALRCVLPIELTLAKESYARCTKKKNRQEFFKSFYRIFLSNCNGARKVFESRGFREFDSPRWQHQFEALNEAILSLMAFRQTQQYDQTDPNLLTRIAKFHRKDLKVKTTWYDTFVAAVLETIEKHDKVCKNDRNRRPYLLQAWRSTICPGVKYMANR